MKYRSEIDGLRALAVLPVILFHAGFQAFSGGFVGVDVFFVISGYLISTIILDELRQDKFSIVRFYERRARRILPALFLVMAASLPFAWAWLLPRDLRSFSQSLVAVSTFTSNILFWMESSYFGTASELKPLLHTWSLAVEEQFYVLFPLLLMLARHWRRSYLVAAIALVSLAAFAFADWGTTNLPSAVFFLLPSRAWELALGALLAIYLAQEDRRELPRAATQVLGMAGLALILYASFAFSDSTPFPGRFALVPTVGAALVILCARADTLAGKLLGTRVLVWVGTISYSTYLWHQPIFAFARHASSNEPGKTGFLMLCTLTLGLAHLSWRYVEQPFRTSGLFSRRQVFRFALAGSLFFIVVGTIGHFEKGFPSRFSPEINRIAAVKKERALQHNECHSGGEFNIAPASSCSLGDIRHVSVALLGDSHGFAVSKALEDALRARQLGMRMLTYGGCPPVPGVYRANGTDGNQCARYNDEVFRFLVEHPELQTLVIVARWPLYLEGTPFDNGEGGREFIGDLTVDATEGGRHVRHPEAQRKQRVAQRYREAIVRLLARGKRVILVYPVPEAGWDVPDRMIKNILHGEGPVTTSYAAYLARNRDAIRALDDIGDAPGLTRIRPERLFCNRQVPDRCITHIGDEPLYDDDDHLSNFGARLLVSEIAKAIPGESDR